MSGKGENKGYKTSRRKGIATLVVQEGFTEEVKFGKRCV